MALQPDRLITGHFDPIDGAERIAEELAALRDSMLWVHDHTVDGMNAGHDVHELMRDITIPEHFDVGEGYGTTHWNVRAIWENYAGWFHHRSTTELYAAPAAAVAADVVAAAGADALLAAARAHLDAGRPVEALHLTDLVLAVTPNDAAARALAADASRVLLDASVNFWEAAWLRRSIEKLEAVR
jgi:alkyl sulfatase BDS1-like metallo-beta-lactamase superfamily hydrolase